MIGRRLQGKYDVKELIGKGGFATIYAGFDVSLERPVAIKVLDHVEGAGDLKERFLNEARAMAKLSHSNIAAVFDSAVDEGLPYMVMELVKGPALFDLVKASQLTLPQVCAIARQMCAGMKYGHEHGVIHGDLTLRNVMINDADNEQQVKILDFGMAKLMHEDGQTSGPMTSGTAAYMAPEQFSGEAVDGRVDIFAFGVCFHRMLNGFFPFEAEFPAAIMYLIMHEENIAFADEVPEDFRRVVLRCLEKNPDNRYRDFGDLLADIDVLIKSSEGQDSEVSHKVAGLDAYPDRGSKRNPYLNRVMISDPSEFFG